MLLQQADQLAELLPVGLLMLNANLKCTYVNGKWCEMGGVSVAQSLEDGWLNSIHWDDIERLRDDLETSAQSGAGFTVEVKITTSAARVVWAQLEGRARFGLNGQFEGYITTVTDISNQMQAKAALADLANIDPLTRLPNRNCFRQRLAGALGSASPENQVALLYLDLDDFKIVNDSLGHEYGDELLRIVARRMGHALRAGDFVARLGGDEFVVVIQGAPGDQGLKRVGSKLIDSLSQPYHIEQRTLKVGVSIGIAATCDHSTDAQHLLSAADEAMYEAKRAGKNQLCLHQVGTKGNAEKTLQQRLADAIEQHEFQLAFQPEFNAETGRICGCEALLRWHCEGIGNVPPEEFLPLIEGSEQMQTLSGWVISSACATLSDWLDHGLISDNFVMAVNLSPDLVTDEAFAKYFVNCIKAAGVATQHLCVEITEAGMIRDHQACKTVLEHFRAQGLKITLDDFGRGFAALNHLRKFPLDSVKIDRGSVRSLVDSENDRDMLSCIVNLAERLGLRVVAKGIDTPEALDTLQQLNCTALQGFELSKPLTYEQMEVLLQRCLMRAAS